MTRRASSAGLTCAGFLREILDDDKRTQRADILLSNVTSWLWIVSSGAVVALSVYPDVRWWIAIPAACFGVIVPTVARLRTPAGYS